MRSVGFYDVNRASSFILCVCTCDLVKTTKGQNIVKGAHGPKRMDRVIATCAMKPWELADWHGAADQQGEGEAGEEPASVTRDPAKRGSGNRSCCALIGTFTSMSARAHGDHFSCVKTALHSHTVKPQS